MTFSTLHIAVTAVICGLLALAAATWRLPRRRWVDLLAVSVLTAGAVFLWRMSANMPQLNDDGLSGFSANDWAAPLLTFVALSVYSDLRPPADLTRYRQTRALATVFALVINVLTIRPARPGARHPGLIAVVAALIVTLVVVVACSPGNSSAPRLALPLRVLATVPLPAPSARFDYADIDPIAHRLFLAQLGASRLLQIDTASRRVTRITPGLADVHGVIVVPALHRVFVTATGSNQLVALDEASGAQLYRTATGDYPDGLVYVPSTGQLWVSNESGGSETVIDAATGHLVGTVELGGQAGNVRYDAATDRVLVDVQTRNVIDVIDPHTRTILTRASVPGCDHDHGLLLDAANTRAFVACDGNAQLIVLSLPALQPEARFAVGDGPDVLALDPRRDIVYIAAESGIVTTLNIRTTPGQVTGRAQLGDNAHVVAVDPTTGQAYFPILNAHGSPSLLITGPAND